MKRGYKYTVYINGWVCIGDKYIFRIDDKVILNYILARSWIFPNSKKKLDRMLDNYPQSFYNIVDECKRSVIDNAIDEMVKGLQE